MVVHIVRSWNLEGKDNFKRINEIVYAILTFAFGLYYPIIIEWLGGYRSGIYLSSAIDELTLLGNVFIFGTMLVILAWALSAKMRTVKNPELLKEQNNYDAFCENFLKEYPEKSQVKRKITHILPVAVIGGIIAITHGFKYLLGNAWSDYALFIVIIVGMDFALTFLLQDLIRLFDFSYMPPNAIKMCFAGLTPDELNTFSSTSVMVFAFGPFIFFSFPIFFIVILITSVADAMATIFGLIASDKKHHFPKGTDKSIEGYVGGVFFTFICTIFGVMFSNFLGLSNWSWELTVFLGFLLSIVFFLIDAATTKIKLQDNYLNPFIIGGITILILLLLNIPIFALPD